MRSLCIKRLLKLYSSFKRFLHSSVHFVALQDDFKIAVMKLLVSHIPKLVVANTPATI